MSKPLTNAQQALLQTFNFEMTEAELADFQQMLVDYFAEKITNDVDAVFEERGWGDEKVEEWANTHMRTPYRPSE